MWKLQFSIPSPGNMPAVEPVDYNFAAASFTTNLCVNSPPPPMGGGR